MRLQVKVTLLAVAIMFTLGAITTATLLWYQRHVSISDFQRTSEAVARSVKTSLEECMLIGNRAFVQEALTSIASSQLVNSVSVTSEDGVIAGSSEFGSIGAEVTDPVVLSGLRGNEFMGFVSQGTSHSFRAVTPVLNDPRCQICHAPGQSVLGVIDLRLDTGLLSSHMRTETVLIAALGALSFVAMGAGLAVMLRRTVLKRLSSLANAAATLSTGDYSARAEITAKDEIGILAESFNNMASSVEQRDRKLEEAAQKMALWNSQLENAVAAKTKELSLMNAVLSKLSHSLDPRRVLSEAFTEAATRLGVDSGIAILVDPSPSQVVTEYHTQDLRSPLPVQTMVEACLHSIKDRKTLTLEIDHGAGTLPSLVVAIPLGSERPVGAIAFATREKDRLDSDTLKIMNSACEALAIALENAHAAQTVEEANRVREQLLQKLISAQEEERRRIARELHDEATQSLAALSISLDDVADTLPSREKAVKNRLALLKDQAVATLSGVRDLALQLRPSSLDDIGLSAATEWFARGYLERRGVDVSVGTVGHPFALPSYSETMLFRIAQECLVNVAHHADARRVKVEFRYDESVVSLRVADDGKGFDVSDALGSGTSHRNLGLHGMRERASLLGGELTIESTPGHGTTIKVTMPVGTEGQGKK